MYFGYLGLLMVLKQLAENNATLLEMVVYPDCQREIAQ